MIQPRWETISNEQCWQDKGSDFDVPSVVDLSFRADLYIEPLQFEGHMRYYYKNS